MPSIKESALAYEPKQTLNIADLPKVSVDLPLMEQHGTNKDGVPFSYFYVEFNGEEYRVPNGVRRDLKNIFEKKPEMKFFSVTKKGTGLNTSYTVVPMD